MSKYRPQHLQARLSPAEKRTAWCLERVDGPSESKSSYGKMKRQGRGDCALGFFYLSGTLRCRVLTLAFHICDHVWNLCCLHSPASALKQELHKSLY